jgi:hypothetical protein
VAAVLKVLSSMVGFPDSPFRIGHLQKGDQPLDRHVVAAEATSVDPVNLISRPLFNTSLPMSMTIFATMAGASTQHTEQSE